LYCGVVSGLIRRLRGKRDCSHLLVRMGVITVAQLRECGYSGWMQTVLVTPPDAGSMIMLLAAVVAGCTEVLPPRPSFFH
jgi:hypothetical protein